MRCCFAGVVILALLVAVPARAQDDDKKPDIETAKTAFKAGQEFIKMDRFADAIVEFRKAYAITKDKLVMGQIALAFEKARDYEGALEAVKVYREGLPESDHGSVDAMIKRYQTMISQGRSRKLALPADTKPGEAEDEDLGNAAATAVPTDAAPAGQAEGRKGRFWTWIAAGSAGALALGAMVVGLNAKSKYDDLESTCSPACPNSEVDSVKTRAVAADVLWGLSAGAAVATAVLYFFVEKPARTAPESPQPKEEEEERESDDDDESHLRITPMLGPGGFGLGAAWNY